MNTVKPISLLLVEDDATHRDIVVERLRDAETEFQISTVGTCDDALQRLQDNTFDCVLLDHSLPDGTGDELLQRARDYLVTTPVVAFSTSVDSDVVISEFKGGCADFIPKRMAFRGDQLARTLLRTIKRSQTRAAVDRARSSARLIEQTGRLLDFDGLSPDADGVTIPEKLQFIYETAFQNIHDAVVFIERRSRIIFSNPALKRMLRLDEEEDLPGHPLTTVNDIFTSAAAEAFHRHHALKGRYESTLRAVGGVEVPVLIGQTPLGDEGELCTISDLSRIKEHQRRLERKNKKLAELNQLANKLVDNVSHEFRTPLTVIKGYAEVIQQGLAGSVSDEQHDCLHTILDRTRDLAQLVDDLLDTSKLRAGCLRVDRRPLSARDVFDSIEPAVSQKASAHKVTVRTELEDDLPTLYADGEKIERVILNLVVNAIKFSPEGSEVVLWAKRDGEDDVRIGVSDHGPGIAPEHLNIIFERFKQVGDPYRSSTKGFGLGLNIAHELVVLNYGTMDVKSTLGEGSTFSFTAPVNDPGVVLRRLVSVEQGREERPLRLALLRMTPVNDAAPSDEQRSFVAAQTRSMDLVFHRPARKELFIVGVARDPQGWARRLERARQEALKEFDAPADAAVKVRVAGHWRFPGQSETALRRICAALEGKTEGAVICADAC